MDLPSSLEPAKIDLTKVSFEPALSTSEMRRIEEVCQSFGVQRRIALILATKSRPEITLALKELKRSSDEDVFTLLDCVSDYVERLKATTEIAEMVQARMFLAAHDAFGVPFEDTEPDNSRA